MESSTLTCPECKQEVAESDETCPNCKAPLREAPAELAEPVVHTHEAVAKVGAHCYVCDSPATLTCSSCKKPICTTHEGSHVALVSSDPSTGNTLCQACQSRAVMRIYIVAAIALVALIAYTIYYFVTSFQWTT